MRYLFPLVALAFTLPLTACGPAEEAADGSLPGSALGVESGAEFVPGKADSVGWLDSGNLHFDVAHRTWLETAETRRVFSFYAGASADRPVQIQVRALAGDAPVQMVVFGPLKPGPRREQLGHAGYGAPTFTAELKTTLTETGHHLVVVAGHRRATPVYDLELSLSCTGGSCQRTDAVIAPRTGALVSKRVEVELDPSLAGREVELYTFERYTEVRHLLGRTAAQGGVAVFDLAGHELRQGQLLLIVVPGVDERGVEVRHWSGLEPGVDWDRIYLSDFGHVFEMTGAARWSDGGLRLGLRSETLKQLLAEVEVEPKYPAQRGDGLRSFDTSFEIDLERVPREGHVLSVGAVDGDGYQRFGCFRFCNDLSGESTCEPGEVACPDAP